MSSLACALQGLFLTRLTILERVMLVVVAFALIHPALWMAAIGLPLLAIVLPGRFTGKPLALTGLLAMALGNGLCAVRSFELMLVGRFVAGFGAGLCMVCFSLLFVESFERRQGRLLVAFHATISIGAVITIWLVRPLALWIGSWPMTFGLAALLTLIVAGLLTMHPFPTRPADRSGPTLSGLFRVLRHPIVLTGPLLIFGFGFANEGVNVFMPACAETELGHTAAVGSTILACFWIGTIAGRWVSIVMLSWVPEKPLVIGGVVLSAALLLLSLQVTLWPVMATLVFIAGAGAGPITPLTVSLVSRYAPQQKVSVVALCQIVAGLGSAAGPRVVGQIGDAYSLTTGLIWAAAFFMATVVPIATLLIWLKATGRANGPNSQ